jgi:hypothetical protein
VYNLYLTAKRSVDLRNGGDEPMQTLAIFRLCANCAKDSNSYADEMAEGFLPRNATNEPDETEELVDTKSPDTPVNAISISPPRLSDMAKQAVAVRIVFGTERLGANRTKALAEFEKRDIAELVKTHADIKAPDLASQLHTLLWDDHVPEFVSVRSGLSPKDLSLLGSIVKSTKIPTMRLSWNKLSGPVASQALRAIISPGNVHELDLSWNKLGSMGSLHIAAALAAPSCRLVALNLSSNDLGPTGATHIARSLKNNAMLATLNLSFNDFEYEGAAALSDMLRYNNTIRSLNIRNNNIGQRGAEDLANALKSNITLQELIVVDNHIGERGAVALSQFLRAPAPKLIEYIGGQEYFSKQKQAELERKRLQEAH